MEIKIIDGGVTTPQGFKASGIHCGIRHNKTKNDLALIVSDNLCVSAVCCTNNKVKAAPVYLTKQNIKEGMSRAILVNSGNANACTPTGYEDAKDCVSALAQSLNIKESHVIVNSTGVIGQTLPKHKIINAIPTLVDGLSKEVLPVATAIMTTDTFPKTIAATFYVGGKMATIGAVAKGSGMIHPNMATMLSFLTTDVNISHNLLQKSLNTSVNNTYNMISVDGDTSTNDMVAILASGSLQNDIIKDENSQDYKTFLQALDVINTKLAKDIAKDGEGATKLLTCNVIGASKEEVAREVAKSIISSNLVKTAMFGEDANWGRIICATGYANIESELVQDKIDVSFFCNDNKIDVCKNGAGINFNEELAKAILSQKEITIEVNLNEGDKKATSYGCDLTYDYVKINGDYRT